LHLYLYQHILKENATYERKKQQNTKDKILKNKRKSIKRTKEKEVLFK
jgi:hypothetical protein